ncbi:hypothetical protein LguiB_009043 [Lonicera macranthoides]
MPHRPGRRAASEVAPTAPLTPPETSPASPLTPTESYLQKMVLHQTRIVLIVNIITIFISSLTEASNSTCNHYCGTVGSNRTRVPYPFGFSAGCPIELNCSRNGDILIGEFKIQNFTTDYILIDLPALCNRSIHLIKQLINHNFALTWRNNLLLQNCSSAISSCLIPLSSLAERWFPLQGCESRSNENISCYSEGYRGIAYMDYDNLTRSNCSVLFSSIAVDLNNGTNTNPALSFQRLELGWWVNGTECRCGKDAVCVMVSPPAGGEGYRCRCKEGFDGDGFVDGNGCRKVYLPRKTRRLLKLGLILGGGIVALSILSYMVFRRWQKAGLTHAKSFLPSHIRRFSLAEIKSGTNNFDNNLVIGVGGFGNVYKGCIDNGATTVAIKRLNVSSHQGIREFETEIEMLSKLRHLHLVSLIGCCDDNGEMVLVYDYMANGTLRAHLSNSNNPLSWKHRLQICIGSARGLQYLHTSSKHKIIHRDVKSTNILLDERWVAKVSDFGLSKMGPTGLSHTHVSTVVKGTFGYLDPEYYQLQRLTDKSDVYSFGVVLFEVLSSKPAIIEDIPEEPVNLAEWARRCYKTGTINDIIDLHVREEIASKCLKKFVDVAYSCIQEQGINRPSMSDVVLSLELALQLQEAAENMSANGDALETVENFTNLPFHLGEDASTEHNESLLSVNNESLSAEFGMDEVETRGDSNRWAQDCLNLFDNTLDIVHSTLFLDGWIGIGMMEFVLFDWDRVLRPKGILRVDKCIL